MARGMASSRVGKPPISLQTIINRLARKKIASIRDAEALDAARVLSQDPRTRAQRYRDSAAIGAVGHPLVRALGNTAESITKHKVTSKKRLIAAAAMGFKKQLTKPDLAKQVTEGVIGGGGINALREGLEIGRAKKKVKEFLGHNKAAAPVPQKSKIPLQRIDDNDIDYEV